MAIEKIVKEEKDRRAEEKEEIKHEKEKEEIVEDDSAFGLAVAKSIAKFQPCKDALEKAAKKLDERIVKPILKKLSASGSDKTNVLPLPLEESETIDFLIKEHSKEGGQWGGCMREYSQATIESEIGLKVRLLENISYRLSSEKIKKIQDEDELAGTMKAITDCCFCYVEYFPPERKAFQSDYERLKKKVTPTAAELAMRIPYTEVGGVAHVATAYGIGREDVKPMKEEDKISGSERYDKSGKSQFTTVDLLARIGYVILRYDIADAEYKKALASDQGSAHSLGEIKKRWDVSKKLMDLYGVPLDLQERVSQLGPLFMHTAIHAASYTCFLGAGDVFKISPNAAAPVPQDGEAGRLAALSVIPKNNIPTIQQVALSCAELGQLPLVAGASGTTARTLIALQDMGVFTKSDGTFDIETAQYIAIALCGTLVHGGHHSVLEVGDIYNRLLQYHAEKVLFDCPASANVPYPAASRVYPEYIYKAGDYNSFVPKDLRNVEPLHALLLSIKIAKSECKTDKAQATQQGVTSIARNLYNRWENQEKPAVQQSQDPAVGNRAVHDGPG